MKALSVKQIARCETSKQTRCKCRCQGRLHGIRQGDWNQLPLPLPPIPPEQQHVTRQERVA